MKLSRSQKKDAKRIAFARAAKSKDPTLRRRAYKRMCEALGWRLIGIVEKV